MESRSFLPGVRWSTTMFLALLQTEEAACLNHMFYYKAKRSVSREEGLRAGASCRSLSTRILSSLDWPGTAGSRFRSSGGRRWTGWRRLQSIWSACCAWTFPLSTRAGTQSWCRLAPPETRASRGRSTQCSLDFAYSYQQYQYQPSHGASKKGSLKYEKWLGKHDIG